MKRTVKEIKEELDSKLTATIDAQQFADSMDDKETVESLDEYAKWLSKCLEFINTVQNIYTELIMKEIEKAECSIIQASDGRDVINIMEYMRGLEKAYQIINSD